MASSTLDWIVDRLADKKEIASTSIVGTGLLNIVRKDGPPLSVTASPLNAFGLNDVKMILQSNDADFVLHTFKDPFIDGSVYSYLDSERKVIGGFSDFFRVLNQEDNWPYLPKEVRFIVRGLEQHTKVSSVQRLDNKRYEISRYGLETVTIIALYDYDLSVESIRDAVDNFGSFDAVLKANPNGRISSSAVELADSREIKVFKWGELLGKLNHKWT
jgi:hypothetical protein